MDAAVNGPHGTDTVVVDADPRPKDIKIISRAREIMTTGQIQGVNELKCPVLGVGIEFLPMRWLAALPRPASSN